MSKLFNDMWDELHGCSIWERMEEIYTEIWEGERYSIEEVWEQWD